MATDPEKSLPSDTPHETTLGEMDSHRMGRHDRLAKLCEEYGVSDSAGNSNCFIDVQTDDRLHGINTILEYMGFPR